MLKNEPKCNIQESRINLDDQRDYQIIYENDMTTEEVI